MTVYTLPKKQPASEFSVKAIKGSPPSLYYAIVKVGSSFQVVTKSGGIVQASFPAKAFAFEWIADNDPSADKEVA